MATTTASDASDTDHVSTTDTDDGNTTVAESTGGEPVCGSETAVLTTQIDDMQEGVQWDPLGLFVDTVGIGRMVLSYPTLPADSLNGTLNKKLICRTFSDCTTGPRNGLVSGCYPLDPFYRTVPDYQTLAKIKQGA